MSPVNNLGTRNQTTQPPSPSFLCTPRQNLQNFVGTYICGTNRVRLQSRPNKKNPLCRAGPSVRQKTMLSTLKQQQKTVLPPSRPHAPPSKDPHPQQQKTAVCQSHESVRGRGLPLFLVIWVWLPGTAANTDLLWELFNTQSGATGEGGLQCIRGGTGRATGRAKPDKLTHSKINQVSTSCYIHYTTNTTEPSPAWITRPALFETYTVDYCTSGRSALNQRERGRSNRRRSKT